jgi:single-strand DNA-binding protein
MNVLSFTGNAGRDAETRFTPAGDAITSFSVALSSGYGDKKVTTWLNCSLFGKRGETLAQYITKGTLLGVVGEFQARPYTTKEGAEKISLEVRVSDVTLLGKKDGDSVPTQPKTAPANKQNDGTGFDDMADDIPFINIYRGKRAYSI